MFIKNNENSSGFPLVRMRRNRIKDFSRRLISENVLTTNDLIQPLFVTKGKFENSYINSMPGIKRHSLLSIISEAKEIYNLGIPAIALFPFIDEALKDEVGSEALNENNIICEAIKAIKNEVPRLGVICDVALDPYTNHGHDGIIINDEVDNDETLKVLSKQAINQVNSGCDIIAPSDMMDGRVKAIRLSLDENGFKNTPILSYSAKYSSVLYGPFRDALGSKVLKSKLDGKKSYQMDPSNSKEAIREIQLDIDEGADMIMIKPALSYLDIIKSASENFNIPVFAYQVSGEYSMIKAAAEKEWIDESKAIKESLISIKRSGASGILTYFAKEVAKSINK